VVLKNSGHEARFTDWMVRDEKTEETFRADHLIEDFIEKKIDDKNTKE
jgi:glycyl-tRNA synthetase